MDTRSVSVIIPSFNKGNLILQTVQSVLRNDYILEVLIVDDASTDPKTLQAYDEILEECDICRLLTSMGKGPGSARNTGLREAKGAYVLFIDSDDLITDNYVSSALKALTSTSSNCAYTYSDTIIFGSYLGLRLTPEYSSERLTKYNSIPVTCVYKMEAVQKIGPMSEDLLAMEDWDYFLKFREAGFVGVKMKAEYNAFLLYRQGLHQSVNSLARTIGKRVSLRREILRRHNLLRGTSIFWDMLAIVFSFLKPLVIRKERAAYSTLPLQIRSAIQQLIA